MHDKASGGVQKVRDAAGKVIGVYSKEDGNIRAPDGRVIATKNSEGVVVSTEGLAMEGVTIS